MINSSSTTAHCPNENLWLKITMLVMMRVSVDTYLFSPAGKSLYIQPGQQIQSLRAY